jgi:hypothetical protein
MDGKQMSSADALAEEAERFGNIENAYLRSEFWAALPVFREEIVKRFDMAAGIRRHLAGRDRPVALTLACGDMSGEYNLLKGVGISEIDAFDISEGQREKFYRDVYDGEVHVNYEIADVNAIMLEAARYDLVYIQFAYHHIEQLEHVADQIRIGLKDDGILAIVEYIGTNYLQRSPSQRDLCGAIWRAMPERYRIARAGHVVQELRIPPKDSLPPYEAIRSEEILPVLQSRFEAEEIFFYGGILMPLFNGFASNFTESPEDERFQRVMWDYDRWLLATGAVEPDYMKAIFIPRAVVLAHTRPTEAVSANSHPEPPLASSWPAVQEVVGGAEFSGEVAALRARLARVEATRAALQVRKREAERALRRSTRRLQALEQSFPVRVGRRLKRYQRAIFGSRRT